MIKWIVDLIEKYNLHKVCWFNEEAMKSPKWHYKIEWWIIKFYRWGNWQAQSSEIKMEDFVSNVNLKKLIEEETLLPKK